MITNRNKYLVTGIVIVVVCVSIIVGVKANRGFPESVEMSAYKIRGNPEAKHFLVEYSDFSCPYCRELQPIMKEVLAAYPNDLKLIFKHYPLGLWNERSVKAAEANECAGDQGKFWEYHDKIWERQTEWVEAPTYVSVFTEIAQNVGLDTVAFRQCYDSGSKEAVVIKDRKEGRRFFVQGTPTLVLDGRKIITNYDLPYLKQDIDEALARDGSAK